MTALKEFDTPKLTHNHTTDKKQTEEKEKLG
jgi:hypothetical protein